MPDTPRTNAPMQMCIRDSFNVDHTGPSCLAFWLASASALPLSFHQGAQKFFFRHVVVLRTVHFGTHQQRHVVVFRLVNFDLGLVAFCLLYTSSPSVRQITLNP